MTDDQRTLSRTRLLSSLADLCSTGISAGSDDKTTKRTPSSRDGSVWIKNALNTIAGLRKDGKHAVVVRAIEDDHFKLVEKVLKALTELEAVRTLHSFLLAYNLTSTLR